MKMSTLLLLGAAIGGVVIVQRRRAAVQRTVAATAKVAATAAAPLAEPIGSAASYTGSLKGTSFDGNALFSYGTGSLGRK